MRAFLFLGLTLMGFALQAQDDCLFTADITTSTGLWGDEVSWTLYTADGDVVAAQDGFESNATSTTTACLEDSCYVLEMLDTFGDGWNGAEVTISLPVLGLELGAYTLESGDYQALSIGFGDCPDNDWTGSGGGNGGGNGGGVVDTYGCMDPAASNYDPAATIHCCCEYDVDCTGSNTLTLVESGGIDSVFFGWFLQYTVVGTNGLPWSPTFTGVNDAGQWVTEGCIADGCYNVTVYNSFSTEPVSVDVLLNGEVVDTYTLTPGEYQFDTALGINVDDCAPFVLGCTDPEAPNYNADATIDNGTCLEPCDCPDVFEPVCGYDYYSGVTVTFNNLCELECAGAYFQWEGDCADIPVYGCMDPEALNYDPNATLDNGYCQYIPECGEDPSWWSPLPSPVSTPSMATSSGVDSPATSPAWKAMSTPSSVSMTSAATTRRTAAWLTADTTSTSTPPAGPPAAPWKSPWTAETRPASCWVRMNSERCSRSDSAWTTVRSTSRAAPTRKPSTTTRTPPKTTAPASTPSLVRMTKWRLRCTSAPSPVATKWA